ncbi:MAG: YtxH domain-containing protein [Muribaculaceae bacterium]|nr:YtxH domain-containing protein [Muribaculaceae bacterium]
MKGFMTFVLGAAVGAAVTALLTPTTGEELRERIKLILQKKGIIAADDVDELVEMIASEVEEARK